MVCLSRPYPFNFLKAVFLLSWILELVCFWVFSQTITTTYNIRYDIGRTQTTTRLSSYEYEYTGLMVQKVLILL